ncbi:Hypothetical protein A7982_08132 [Minicystis rosea]|nr:Hypothetical protein A7982_08132 [Minicystis rosea]
MADERDRNEEHVLAARRGGGKRGSVHADGAWPSGGRDRSRRPVCTSRSISISGGRWAPAAAPA